MIPAIRGPHSQKVKSNRNPYDLSRPESPYARLVECTLIPSTSNSNPNARDIQTSVTVEK